MVDKALRKRQRLSDAPAPSRENGEGTSDDVQETDLGTFPADWKLVPLGEVASETVDRNAGLEFSRDDVLTVDNEEGLIPSDRKLGEDFTRYKLVRQKHFAYNPMRLNVGSIGLREKPETAIVSPDYIVFQCHEDELLPEYLDQFRRCHLWRRQIQQSGQGSIRIRYYFRHIAEFRLPLPSVAEQRAIAHVLQTVQQAKQVTEKVIAATREMKKSLSRQVFAYGLVPCDQADRIETKETQDGLTTTARWKVVKLGTVAQLSTGTTPSTARPDYYGGTVPFVKTAEIENNRLSSAKHYVTERAIEDYSLRLYQPGTVFMAMYGQGKTRGQVALLGIEAATTQNTAAIVPGESLLPEFLWQFLMSRYEALRSTGFHGHLPHLNLGYVRELEIPLPPLDEQEMIAAALGSVQKIRWTPLSRPKKCLP